MSLDHPEGGCHRIDRRGGRGLATGELAQYRWCAYSPWKKLL